MKHQHTPETRAQREDDIRDARKWVEEHAAASLKLHEARMRWARALMRRPVTPASRSARNEAARDVRKWEREESKYWHKLKFTAEKLDSWDATHDR